MPPEAKQTDSALDSVALKLFSERSARIHGRAATQVAVQCFRDAETFLAVQAGYKTGQYELKQEASILADCYCPNQKKTHPHNLVSRELGDINRVRKILKDLDADKGMESYGELEWDKPTTNIARDIFPSFVKAADAAASN